MDKTGTPTTFIAKYGSAQSVFSTVTGARLQNLLPPETPQDITGFSRTATGDVLFSVERPRPAVRETTSVDTRPPDSCGGTNQRIDHRTAKTTVQLTIPPTRAVRSPSLSPDGTELEYSTGPCQGFLDEALAIRNLTTGRTSTYRVPNAGVVRFSWGPDHRIAFTVQYTAGRVGQATTGYITTRAGQTSTFTRAQLQPAIPGCETQAVAYDVAGLLILRGCPTLIGTARLDQLDHRGRTLWTLTPPAEPGGGTVSVAPNGHTVLVATYSPTAGNFVTFYDRTHLVTQHRYSNNVYTSVNQATW